MAAFKEDVAYQLILTTGADELVDDIGELHDDMNSAVKDTFEAHGVEATSDGWEVRNDPNA